MIISESNWVFTGFYDNVDDSFPADYLTKGEIVTILELNTVVASLDIRDTKKIENFQHFVLVNNQLRCIITNKQLENYFLPLEEWRCSKINSILND